MKRAVAALLLALVSAVSSMAASDPGPTGPTSKSILYGGSATLWPNFKNGTGVIDNSVGTVTSGQSYSVSPLVTTTYTLTITNPAGDTTTGTVTVNVATVSMNAVSPATKTVSCTKTVSFSSSVTGAVDTTIDWSVDGVPGGNSTVGTIAPDGTYTAPATPGSHTIMATSHAKSDVTQTASVTVVALPTIDSALTATPSSINYGATSVLAATFSNGTAKLVGGATNQAVTSPVNFTTPALSTTTTYTLTVTNAAGDTATGTVTVTVSSVSMTNATVTNNKLSLTKTLQVNGGVVSNSADTSVIWSVNGVDGGNAELGTINATGLYQAPATMPSSTAPATGNVVTIRVRSAADPTVYKEVTITLYELPVINYFVVN
jgi:hypothetical protein